MYQGINTLKSRWFKFAFVATVIWDVLFMSIFWIYFWAYAPLLGFGIFFLSNALIIGTIIPVGIRILIYPPMPRPWYVRFGIYLSFLSGINAGIIAFFSNGGQLPYLPLYTFFVTVGLLALDGYLLHYAYKHPPKQKTETSSSDPPKVILADLTPKPVVAPVPMSKLAMVIVLTIFTQVAVIGWSYWSIAKPQYKSYREFRAFSKECELQDKFSFVHTHMNGQEVMASEDILSASRGFKLKGTTYHCYGSMEELLSEYPNFYDIKFQLGGYKGLETLVSQDVAWVIENGQLGKKGLYYMGWLNQMRPTKITYSYTDNEKLDIIPWQAEYIYYGEIGYNESYRVKDPPTVTYTCADAASPLLKPEGFDATKWQTEIIQLDNEPPEPGEFVTSYYAKEDEQLYITTYRPVESGADMTRCVLYDKNGTLPERHGIHSEAFKPSPFSGYGEYGFGDNYYGLVVVDRL